MALSLGAPLDSLQEIDALPVKPLVRPTVPVRPPPSAPPKKDIPKGPSVPPPERTSRIIDPNSTHVGNHSTGESFIRQGLIAPTCRKCWCSASSVPGPAAQVVHGPAAGGARDLQGKVPLAPYVIVMGRSRRRKRRADRAPAIGFPLANGGSARRVPVRQHGPRAHVGVVADGCVAALGQLGLVHAHCAHRRGRRRAETVVGQRHV